MKGLIIAAALLFGAAAFFIVSFTMSMKADAEKEKEVTEGAKVYLEEHFNDDFQIYDTLYDNMGNFEFLYAAKVSEKSSGLSFFIYPIEDTGEWTDTYLKEKWEREVERAIRPLVDASFKEKPDFHAYLSEDVGRFIGVEPLKGKSYADYLLDPTIRVTVERPRTEEDDPMLRQFVKDVREQGVLNRGQLIVEFMAENGVAVEEEWHDTF